MATSTAFGGQPTLSDNYSIHLIHTNSYHKNDIYLFIYDIYFQTFITLTESY